MNEKYIADVTVHEVNPSGWVNVIDKNKQPYALTSHGATYGGIKVVRKGMKCKLYISSPLPEIKDFYFLRPT